MPRAGRRGWLRPMVDLDDEAKRATAMLKGKAVRQVWRPRAGEVGVEFTDGSRWFVDASGSELEISITGSNNDH